MGSLHVKFVANAHCWSSSGWFGAHPEPATVTVWPFRRFAFGVTVISSGGGMNASGAVTMVRGGSTTSAAAMTHVPGLVVQSRNVPSGRKISLNAPRCTENAPAASVVAVSTKVVSQSVGSDGAGEHSSTSTVVSGRKPLPLTVTKSPADRPVSGVTVIEPRVTGGGGAGANEIGTVTIVVSMLPMSAAAIRQDSTAQSTVRPTNGTKMKRRTCSVVENAPDWL